MPVATHIWINEPLVDKGGAAKLLYPEIDKMLPFLGEKQKVYSQSGSIAGILQSVLHFVVT